MEDTSCTINGHVGYWLTDSWSWGKFIKYSEETEAQKQIREKTQCPTQTSKASV